VGRGGAWRDCLLPAAAGMARGSAARHSLPGRRGLHPPCSTVGRVLPVADDDTSIKVSRQTRERLARLATDRRTTLKDVVEELAAATFTAAEREQRARSVLAEHFGIDVTDAELAASARLREMIAARDAAA